MAAINPPQIFPAHRPSSTTCGTANPIGRRACVDARLTSELVRFPKVKDLATRGSPEISQLMELDW